MMMNGKTKSLLMWASLIAMAMLLQASFVPEVNTKAGEAQLALVKLGGAFLFLLILLVAKAATVAFGYCASEYASKLFREGSAILRVSPWKCFLVGTVNLILAVILLWALFNLGPLSLFGILLFLLLLAGLLSARTLVYQRVGARLVGDLGDPESPPGARAHFCGGAATELAFLTPIVGQAVMIVVTLTTFGALVLAILSRSGKTAE